MKNKILLLVCFLIVLSGIGIASAETLTGTLGSSGITSSIFNTTVWNPDVSTTITYLTVTNIENTENPFSIVRFMDRINLDDFDANAPPTTTTGVSFRLDDINGVIIGSGAIGYQRTYNVATPPVETPYGFEFLLFNSWNITGLSGTKYIYLDYNRSELYNASISYLGNPTGPTNWIGFAGLRPDYSPILNDGQLVFNRYIDVYSEYTVTKPSGLGIAGTVLKSYGGTSFNSRIFITNASDGVITSDTVSNPNTFNFTVMDSQIKIKMLAPSGVWYNSSILFASVTPTVTPTPTTTIPPGYIVTYFRTFDPLGNSDIHGTDISLYDVEAATWTNYTSDADGRGEIYTLPYHTVNAYGHYPTAGIYNDGILTGAETGYYGNSGKLYYLDMYPYTPPPAGGYTYLYTTVREADDKSPVLHASIGITTVSTGAYYGTNSGSTGVSVDTFPNQTALRIVVSKSGYQTATVVTNTGTGTTKYVYVELTRSTVTPTITATPSPGEITARPTYSPGCDPSAYDAAVCSEGKDSDMMNQIRDAGPGLIGLAIIATMLGLVKLMMKK